MMKMAMKLGFAVVVMGIFENLIFGGSADRGEDIPALV
jgi:hypothetical protein